ncbi:LiaG family protein [Cytobacillus sp. SAFR-174]|uniref:LiaG family protein n=1 Tax=Cytobacillus sp. SAFR-174 TaxID=3436868 RepID=UPI003F80CE60
MKRILVIFIILISFYLLFTGVNSWLSFGGNSTEASLSKRINTISIDVSSSDTVIIPENRNDVRAELDGKGKVTVNKSGNEIRVEYKRKWLDGFQFFNNKSNLKVYVPEDFNKSMSIDIGSGRLNFAGESESKPFELESLDVNMSSGKVSLANIKTDEFEHEGSSGMMDANHLFARSGEIDMSSGKVKIRNYQGKLDAGVSSGHLDIMVGKLIDSIKVEASSGFVRLDLPDDADFILKGKASSGHISSTFELDDEERDKNDISGKHGSGEHDIRISVSSGKAEIN